MLRLARILNLKETSAPGVDVEGAPGVPSLAAAVLDVQVEGAQVVYDILEGGTLLWALVPAGLHERGIALGHVWGDLRPVAGDDLEEDLHGLQTST